MEIPKKIEICPIVDSVIELRFSSMIFPNAVFGLVFNSLKKDFPQVDKLPILQLPEQVRDSDPNFKFKAHYKLTSEDGYSVQVGPDVIVVGSPIPYRGWDNFFEKVKLVVEKVFDAGVIEKVIRLGVRVINFFELDIFREINLEIFINSNHLLPRNTQIKTEIEKDGFSNTLNIANNATQRIGSDSQRFGSIIDIDTFKNYDQVNFYNVYKSEISSAHNAEKEIFFTLLKKDFLKSLKPHY